MEAGQDEDDFINYLIIDCGEKRFEQQNPGLLYVATSRAKTLGDFNAKYPLDSSLYWFGSGMCESRVRYAAYKLNPNRSGEYIKCESAVKRTKWVLHLEKIAAQTNASRYSEDILNNIERTTLEQAINGHRYNSNEIDTQIMTMMKEPNEKWEELKKSEKYTVPRAFF
jgi:hypothetical protein